MQRPLRVLLTGGAGFLGKRIISELGELAAAREQEVHVRTLDLLPCETADDSVVGDITDASTVDEAARDIDVILHGGPLIGIGEDRPYPDHYIDAYSESKALAEQAVLVNSVSVHSTRLADDLGYQPRFSPEEAFERVITYYAPRFGKGLTEVGRPATD
ncbi:MAG: hypothetical protein DRH23_16980 [Deltaproteobacteria bacterium]|nr:NAD-dependent epimerase/dehydratase family protein [Deltaproteobacteria bacterium]MBW2188926.1 NAD-dependent epimerase/dehydratase family protein [Deltaproteobacteria bacterium]MBW2223227.1 NAD-dependent epimerase/dehydratase family protein [Deltaproteobacteria bacterium]MBW2402947.1 NAD-dependent epimerase/dehydratase family protein [Deltaproteobacteria bacterium]MBW2547049.1 NAD-dependent epimerase/dehydratase family protein [Deltaproteobacteria bacterium]